MDGRDGAIAEESTEGVWEHIDGSEETDQGTDTFVEKELYTKHGMALSSNDTHSCPHQ